MGAHHLHDARLDLEAMGSPQVHDVHLASPPKSCMDGRQIWEEGLVKLRPMQALQPSAANDSASSLQMPFHDMNFVILEELAWPSQPRLGWVTTDKPLEERKGVVELGDPLEKGFDLISDACLLGGVDGKKWPCIRIREQFDHRHHNHRED